MRVDEPGASDRVFAPPAGAPDAAPVGEAPGLSAPAREPAPVGLLGASPVG